MTIFNECNIVNLLETTLFNAAAVESLGDAAVDLADYCVRQMTTITVGEAAANDAEYERKGPKRDGHPYFTTEDRNVIYFMHFWRTPGFSVASPM